MAFVHRIDALFSAHLNIALEIKRLRSLAMNNFPVQGNCTTRWL
jgi:hypothetical protein